MALWDSYKEKEIKTKLFHPTKKKTELTCQVMPRIANEILRFIFLTLYNELPDVLVIEYPQWEGSERGAIASQKGYTLNLAFLAGYIGGYYALPFTKKYFPTPRDWKGNMPKSATVHRVQKYFGTLQISEHEMDAVGLILWAKELPGIKN